MFALIENGTVAQYPYSFANVRAANPNTSFPAEVDDATMESFGAYRVYFVTPPAFDERTQELVEITPVFSAAGNRWTQVFEVRNLSAEQVQQKIDTQATAMRYERNTRLSASDWTQVADAPVDKAVWAAYRQELRDITKQAGFPWDVQWPVEPGTPVAPIDPGVPDEPTPNPPPVGPEHV